MSAFPSCFGKSWDPKALECAGGLDPLYTNPVDSTHRRERCSWYSQCSIRTTAADLERKNVVPVQNLVRPPQPVPLVTQPASPPPPRVLPVAPPTQSNYVTQQQAYHGPVYVPANYQQPGMQVLGYLAVPEPVNPAVPWWRRLLHEMIRAACKGLFHTGANFFDHNTLTKPPDV